MHSALVELEANTFTRRALVRVPLLDILRRLLDDFRRLTLNLSRFLLAQVDNFHGLVLRILPGDKFAQLRVRLHDLETEDDEEDEGGERTHTAVPQV